MTSRHSTPSRSRCIRIGRWAVTDIATISPDVADRARAAAADGKLLIGHLGLTSVHIAASLGDPDLLASALAAGGDPQAPTTVTWRDDTDQMPFTRPCASWHPLTIVARTPRQQEVARCVDILVDAGASPDPVPPGDPAMPLRMATEQGHTAAAVALIRRGAQVLWSSPGVPFVSTVVRHPEILAAACAAGADPNATGISRYHPLSLLAQTWSSGVAREADATATEVLLRHGAHPDLPTVAGPTPLDQLLRSVATDFPPTVRTATVMGHLVVAGAGINAVWDPAVRPRDQERRQRMLEMAWHEALRAARAAGRMDELLASLTARLTEGGPAAAWAAEQLAHIATTSSDRTP